ncbi:MAG: hypothetical protein BWY89_01557 [Bacteroidetes bacterium ADurb.BinA012]|nr:MAG: hypothetical protein BWY89_01557 [Bacteroidetes bacterium ADurb.BinA012]
MPVDPSVPDCTPGSSCITFSTSASPKITGNLRNFSTGMSIMLIWVLSIFALRPEAVTVTAAISLDNITRLKLITVSRDSCTTRVSGL